MVQGHCNRSWREQINLAPLSSQLFFYEFVWSHLNWQARSRFLAKQDRQRRWLTMKARLDTWNCVIIAANRALFPPEDLARALRSRQEIILYQKLAKERFHPNEVVHITVGIPSDHLLGRIPPLAVYNILVLIVTRF